MAGSPGAVPFMGSGMLKPPPTLSTPNLQAPPMPYKPPPVLPGMPQITPPMPMQPPPIPQGGGLAGLIGGQGTPPTIMPGQRPAGQGGQVPLLNPGPMQPPPQGPAQGHPGMQGMFNLMSQLARRRQGPAGPPTRGR